MSYKAWNPTLATQSQSLLTSSQDWMETQDSGVDINHLYPPPPHQPQFRAAPSFASRRTLGRPASWQNVSNTESSGRWKFSRQTLSSQENSDSQLLRDMQQHLSEIDNDIANNLGNKMAKLVKESVTFLQSLNENRRDVMTGLLDNIEKLGDQLVDQNKEQDHARFVEELEIPLAALEEQKAIGKQLDEMIKELSSDDSLDSARVLVSLPTVRQLSEVTRTTGDDIKQED